MSKRILVFPHFEGEQKRIAVHFISYTSIDVQKLWQIEGHLWNDVAKFWHLPYNAITWEQLTALFGESEIQVDANDAIYSPTERLRLLKNTQKPQSVAAKSTTVAAEPIVYIRKSESYPVYYLLKVPYEWKDKIKSLKGFWLTTEKEWRLPYNAKKKQEIERVFEGHLQWETNSDVRQTPFEEANKTPKYLEELVKLAEDMTIRRMSYRTIKAYKAAMLQYMLYYNDTHPAELTMKHIRDFLMHLITERQISESYQNTIINGIKYYYEKIQNWPPQFIDIPRPKPTDKDPEILSKQEVKLLLNTITNHKHRLIIKIIYSAGLRIGEVCNLTKDDVHFDDYQLFIKGGKGKKDRYTVLSKTLEPEIRDYYEAYRPTHWLFEGESGGRYSERSVQEIFKKAVKQAKVNPYATTHTLRHSFATHLIRDGVPLNVVQELLGHADPKTTEKYLHITTAHRASIRSPLDDI